MQEAVGLGHDNRTKRPRGGRPSAEPFLAPTADGRLVYVADADIAEKREQVIPQQTPVQLLGAHLQDPITKRRRCAAPGPVIAPASAFGEARPARAGPQPQGDTI